jgi:DNA-binding CsgD family transcriptional regulator
MAVTVHLPLLSSKEWTRLISDLALSPRQAQIVEHLLHGESDKQIARSLEISVPTVRTHMGRLFHKFGLNDRVELVLYVFACLREDGSNALDMQQVSHVADA